ncbi:MAG: MOSC domain-containing protein [Thermoanaerobaculia bacterium]|nr:MOSC domain-containing protein [Thermoanaerobaculia bacterium]
MDPVSGTRLLEGVGIEDNADQGGRRQVTVISAESWARVEEELGAEIDPSARRANLLIEGLDLEETRGRVLRVGPARIHVLGETRPCPRMDEAHPGLMEALGPEWRGGIYGQVVEGGPVTVGDPAGWDGELPLPRSRAHDR